MQMRSDTHQAAMCWLAVSLLVAGGVFLTPFAGSVILALWLGVFSRRLHAPLTRALRGRARLAAALTIALAIAVLVPLAALLVALAIDAFQHVSNLVTSGRLHDLLPQLVTPSGGENASSASSASSGPLRMLAGNFERAWGLASRIAGATAHIVIAMFIVAAGAYGVLVEGHRWYAWAESHAPISRAACRRLAAAFLETGRGLFIGIFGTGLLQAILATGAYLVLEVPQALALGLLTLLFSLVPAVGTALVWAPVAAGLALTGRTGAAIGLALFGILVVGTVDNLVRPYFAKRGQLQLPTYVVLIAMFGGVELIGAAGLLIAPLVIRLAKEAVQIAAEQGWRRGPEERRPLHAG
jgi:predicted PurR-regulated permease PerM